MKSLLSLSRVLEITALIGMLLLALCLGYGAWLYCSGTGQDFQLY